MDGGLLAPLCPPRQGPQDPGPASWLRQCICPYHLLLVVHFVYSLILTPRTEFARGRARYPLERRVKRLTIPESAGRGNLRYRNLRRR